MNLSDNHKLLFVDDASTKENRDNASLEIKKIQIRIESLQDKYADNKIEYSDYQATRTRYETHLRSVKEQTQERKEAGKDVKDQMEFSYLFLKQLPSIFLKSSLDVQYEIRGSIFPEKISFSENRCRTKRMNEVAELIRSVNRPFGINKKGQFCKKTKSSYVVAPGG